jgi:NAD(P)-dependent dehydrogenase (short-subunit alcohol dehydrogenase family)
MFELNGKTAVVTGAGSGIGEAIATLFAKQGAHVAVLDLDESAAGRVVEKIRGAGGKADAWKTDVSSASGVKAVFGEIVDRLKRVDILVNNAGVPGIGDILKTTEEDFDRVYRVNVKGVFLCAQAAVEQMLQQGSGVILNMASIASHVGLPDRFTYGMSKGAVLTMTLSIATDYVKRGIRCNCLAPARIHTPFVDGYLAKNYPGREKEMFEKLSQTQPIGRMGKPEEVAYLALYLCSDEAAFVTGQSYPIDGGFLSQ